MKYGEVYIITKLNLIMHLKQILRNGTKNNCDYGLQRFG